MINLKKFEWSNERGSLSVTGNTAQIITNYLELSQYHKRELVVASSDCWQVPTRILWVCVLARSAAGPQFAFKTWPLILQSKPLIVYLGLLTVDKAKIEES